MSKIKSVKYIGECQTYDLEIDHPDHQFYLANGLLTSNSHAISYAYNSYICAWLFNYHPKQWICATLEEEMNGKAEEKAEVLSNLLGMGYKINLPNINISKDKWSFHGDDIVAPLTMIKSINETLAPLIYNNRPFTKIEDLLEHKNIPKNILNKTKLESMAACGALNDLIDERFENDNHFYNFLSEYREKSKRKKYTINEHISSMIGIHKPFSKEEKLNFKMSLMGYYDIYDIVPQKAIKTIKEENLQGISEIAENNLENHVFWFVPTSVLYKKSKNNNNFLEIDATDFSFKSFKIRVFGIKGDMKITPNCGYIGFSSKVSNSSIMIFKANESIQRIF